MVRITTPAVALLEKNRHDQGLPDSHGIRIYGRDDHGDGPRIRLALTFVAEPENDDRPVDVHGTRFYVAPEVAEPLEGVTIATTAAEGPTELELRIDADAN